MKKPSCFTLADALHRETSYVLKLSKLDDLIDYIQQNKFHPTVQQCKTLLLFGRKDISRIDLIFEDLEAPENIKLQCIKLLALLAETYKNPSAYFKWLFLRIKSVKDDELLIYFLLTLKEALTTTISPQIIQAQVLPQCLEILNSTRSSKIFSILMDILEFLQNYPNELQFYFPKLADILVGWSIDPSLPSELLDSLLVSISNYWPFWMASIDHGIELISNLCYDLEQDYGICVEPGKTKKTDITRDKVDCLTLLILKTCNSIFRGLILAGFPAINVGTSFSLASNQSLHLRFLIASEWIIEVASTIGLKLHDMGIEKIMFEIIQNAWQTCTGPDDHLAKVGLGVIEKYKLQLKNFNVLNTDNWIVNVSALFSSNRIHRIKPSFDIIELFLDPSKNGFIFDVYLPLILDNPSFLNHLLVACLTMASFGNPDIPDSFLKLIDSTLIWFIYLGTSTSKKPNIAPILTTSSFSQYRKLLLFLMELVSNLSCTQLMRIYPGSKIFESFRKILVSVSTSSFVSLPWWDELEYSILSYLQNIAKFNKFFLPRILESSDKSFENHDILQTQFAIIKLLLKPNHYGQNVMGLKWVAEIVQFLQGKNVFDTDVEDSGVLKLVEDTLVDLLIGCCIERDWKVRQNVGDIWTLYLSHFSTNRRGISNSPKVISLILSRTRDSDKRVSAAFFKALCSLDAVDTLLNVENLHDLNSSLFKRLIMRSDFNAIFSNNHFLIISDYLGMSEFVRDSNFRFNFSAGLNVELSSWLPNFCIDCRISSQTEYCEFENSLEFMLYWALWQFARYFINNRLKTPFGLPAQTLDCLENVLEGYLVETTEENAEYLSRQSAYIHFLDMLECQILSAATGCSSLLPNPPKPSIIFFHGNISVCNDWFKRIRYKLTVVASKVENNGMVLRHGYSGLCELLDQLSSDTASINVEGILRKVKIYYMAIHDALKRLKDHEGLVGFLEFWKYRTSILECVHNKECFEYYLEAESLILRGRVESGVAKLEPYFNSENPLLPEIHDTVLEGCANLFDWKAVSVYVHQVDNNLPYKDWYLNRLKFWDLGITLEKSSPAAVESFGNSLSRAFKNSVFQRLASDLQPKDSLVCVSYMQKIFNLDLFTAESQQLRALLPYQTIFKQRNYLEVEKNIQLRKSNSKDTISGRSLNEMDLELWSEVYHICRYFENAKKTRDPDLDEIRGLLVNLSRKTGNLRFARRLLDRSVSALTPSAKLRIDFKEARILYAEGKTKDACMLLLDGLSNNSVNKDMIDMEILAKSCSLIVQWNSTHNLNLQDVLPLSAIERALGKPIGKGLIGELFLSRAIELAPLLPKSWSLFASYNYFVGRSLLEELFTADQPKVFAPQFDQANAILKNKESLATFSAEILEQLGEAQRSESAVTDWRDYANELETEKLELIQIEIKQAIFLQFETTTAAYFKFLENSAGKDGSLKAEEVTATLRLIRIFARYGVALKSIFTRSFPTTPLEPWKNVIPQLFSRLMNPENVVRLEISKLIVRIGAEYPHIVVYPTFGDSAGSLNSSRNLSNDSYELIRESLIRLHPDLVAEARVWMKELQRVTVVWEEVWVLGLERLKADLNARHAKLQRDSARIRANSTLSSAEKEEIIDSTTSNLFKPAIYQYEKLCQDTVFRSAETPHEKEFMQKYGDLIAKGHQELISEVSFDNVKSLFATCQLLLSDLKSYISHRPTYSLGSLSPFLAKFNSTGLQIPGLCDESVIVGNLNDQILVLPTKTRPKRISISSQDGRIFPFLLKGHEDLHLDSRIQQLLLVTNQLLGTENRQNLHARTFTVIPFGRKFGMIQWLDGVSGIFGLYRKWQGWDHTAKTLQKRAIIAQPLRPNELFMAKLQKFMKSEGLPSSTPRKSFPTSILLQVYEELVSETPSTIISNEMWTSSHSSTDFHTKTKGFSRSLAVMSILGYILGLGDRHLDNILIDISSGDLVHIDYNVCFEKGLKLAIPETVPFRLTQNFVQACGIFGGFRTSCEEVMGVLRDNREHLLTILETFVYDPLIDWKSDLSTTMLDINLEIGKFSSRILESRSVIHEIVEELRVYCDTILYECKRLGEIVSEGGFAKEMEKLTIRDSTYSCEVMVQKLTKLVQDSKKLLSPLLKIITTIRKLSIGTDFANSSEFENLKSILTEWQVSLRHGEEMQTNFKKFQSIGEFESLQKLENSLLLLSTSLKSMFSKLVLTEVEPLSELFPEEEKKEFTDDQDNLRYNRGSFMFNQEQSKNRTAISVLLRVKQKLEGRDNPHRSRISPRDHVDQLIKAATDPKALCRMYEGWMSWI